MNNLITKLLPFFFKSIKKLRLVSCSADEIFDILLKVRNITKRKIKSLPA